MVTLLNPPTPRTAPKSHSDVLVTDHEKRIEAELAQLLTDIRRIGPTFPDGEPHVLFGELFDDDGVQQYYEALVGTLKSAKKRGVITFSGQMLLKGMHDNVQISIIEMGLDQMTQSTAVTQTKQESTAVAQTTYISTLKQESPARLAKKSPTRSARKLPEKFTFSSSHVTTSATSPSASKRKSGESVDSSKDVASSPWRTGAMRKSDQSPSLPYFPSPHTYLPIVTKQRQDIACTFSDGEAEVEVATRKYEAPPAPAACSDSEVDGSSPRARRARRGRVTLPAAFLKQQSTIDLSGRPPAPRRMRKTQSSRTVTQSSAASDAWTRQVSTSTIEAKTLARKKEPLVVEAAEDSGVDVIMNKVSEKSETAVDAWPSHEMRSLVGEIPANDGNAKAANDGNTKERDGDSSGNQESSKTLFGPSSAEKPSDASSSRADSLATSFSVSTAGKSTSLARTKEASFRIDSEVPRLVEDICRVGSNPGEHSVIFGELFDDEMGQDRETHSITLTETKQESTAIAQTTYISTLKQESPARSAIKLPEIFSFSPSRVTPTATSPSASKRKSGESVDSSKDGASSAWRTGARRKSDQSKPSPFLPSPHTYLPIATNQRQGIARTLSDGEAEVEVATRKYEPPPAPAACSDSEVDGSSPRARRARRGRVTLPAAFLKQQSTIDLSGRPPAPRRMRKTQSSRTVTQSSAASDAWTRQASTSTIEAKPLARKKEPLVVEGAEDNDVDVIMNNVSEKTAVDAWPSHDMRSLVGEKAANYGNTKERDGDLSGNLASSKISCGPSSAGKSSDASLSRADSLATSFSASTAGRSRSLARTKEASFRVDSEVHRLVEDICRVGSNPGEPFATFGELFDDEVVQQTYEALVGTLRSAKRQGFIKFQGQMLFKGRHDNVTIYVVEEIPAIAQAAT